MLTRIGTLTLALFLTTAGAAMAQPDREGLQIFNDISKQVTRYKQFTIFDSIDASIDDGAVVLSGWVTMPYKKADLERRVAKVDGVTSVKNDIQGTATSMNGGFPPVTAMLNVPSAAVVPVAVLPLLSWMVTAAPASGSS